MNLFKEIQQSLTFHNIMCISIMFIMFSCSGDKKESQIIDIKKNTSKRNIIYQDTPEKYFKTSDNYKIFKESESLHIQGNYNEALKKLLELEKSEKENELVLGSLGIVYMDLKRYELSENKLEKAIKINPDFINNLFNLATLYERLKNYEDADMTMQKAENLKKTEQEEFLYYMQRAFLNYKLNNCDKALKFCEKIINSNFDEYYITNAQGAYNEIKEKCVEK
ncbi:tetratricopeptide repeat protein [Flavobacterium sp. CBA20B-1]|uniref:tetratricopeptide repeat protein n=1 Tax=unclassified Flavobacterium TaxID=196869 RepID=UPI0022245481|nr:MULTISPECIES: tetratricopeptide repeat protein [unclassified Flavobacterium]WCM41639.1 tetratricopeptide repeat protein [Flavobacterium sp. CBA20B-1]